MNTDLSITQRDYAFFTPALSQSYSSFVGGQRHDPNCVNPSRIPSNFKNGVESLNYLCKKNGQFFYPWTLYSAGHADLDVHKFAPKESMIRDRDRDTSWALIDSGGFQIGKFVWKAKWVDPTCPAAAKKRKQVLEYMDAYGDYGMTLDVPAWICRSTESMIASGISCFEDSVNATFINNDYFINNRNGNCKFLNVLQGETHTQAEDWYNHMKKYCDPKQYPDRHFNGWAMGGQNMCSTSLMLKRLVRLRHDQLLEKGIHDNMHFLGTSKLEWALLLTDVQRAIRKHHNENFMVTFDCASPFLSSANGQIYTETVTADRKKWSYRMEPSIADKKYAYDNRLFRDVGLSDGYFKTFEDSPFSVGLKVSDVCVNGPGIPNPSIAPGTELDPYNPDHWSVLPSYNKAGKVNVTAWDGFSYAIQMGHNLYRHIEAVQRANAEYDSGKAPSMLVEEKFQKFSFRDLVEEVFCTSDYGKSMALLADYDRFLTSIIGTRGSTGKKEINAKTYFYNLFDEVSDSSDSNDSDDEVELDEQKLEILEKGEEL